MAEFPICENCGISITPLTPKCNGKSVYPNGLYEALALLIVDSAIGSPRDIGQHVSENRRERYRKAIEPAQAARRS
jgi:hypothetical protein